MISLKKKNQLKSRDDVSINEAFELYMLKKFHNIRLNSLTNKMLDFWEKDFDHSIEKHINFLKDNLEDQNKYSSKFSEIFQNMDIFKLRKMKKIKRKIVKKVKTIHLVRDKNQIQTITKIKIEKRKLKQV